MLRSARALAVSRGLLADPSHCVLFSRLLQRPGSSAGRVVRRVAGCAAEKLVLGIESSCDDTGVAIVSSSGRILGEAVASQEEVHRQWGGVVPSLAQEAHKLAIDDVVKRAIAAAKVGFADLDAVAFTEGPGLSLCLQVGAAKARSLAYEHSLPLVPCHHMEAHALVARLGHNVEFPFLCMLVSGGHNLLLIVRGVGDYMQMGTTLDDSVGESFDKVARMLGLDVMPSGGPALEAFAKNGDPHAVPLTLPLNHKKTCDFSYSGLKTAVLLALEERAGSDLGPDTFQARADIAASFQRVAVEQLAQRLKRAMEWAREVEPSVHSVVVAGGVAANRTLRARLDAVARDGGFDAVYPPPRLCTDNGVMVAWVGTERLAEGLQRPPPSCEEAGSDWVQVRPRWPLTSEKHPRCTPPFRKRKPRTPKKSSKIPCESLTDMTRAARMASVG